MLKYHFHDTYHGSDISDCIAEREGRIVDPSPFQAVNATASRHATCKVRRKNLQGLPIAGASAVVGKPFSGGS